MMADEQLREAARHALMELGKAVLAEVRWRAYEHRVMVFATIMASTAVIVVAGAFGLRYLRDLKQGGRFPQPQYPPRHEHRRKRRQQ